MRETLKNNIIYSEKSIVITWIIRISLIFLIILLFLLAIDLMIYALSSIGLGAAQELIKIADIPFISLFIGLLTTALIQSSSTVTSIAVAMVASGTISLDMGIFVIMGANIGTTLTSDIISLSYITNKNKFRLALSAGVIHDFFNIFTTIIIFPLEYYYKILSGSAMYITKILGVQTPTPDMVVSKPVYSIIKPLTVGIADLLNNDWIIAVMGILLLFSAIKLFSTYSYKLLIGKSKDKMKSYIFSNPFKSFSWGLLFTGALQSSSITTSLSVPLVATRKVSLFSVFPFIMGANIGTTITALLAAIFKSEAAVSLAIAHLIFNFIGVLIFLPFAKIRSFPVDLARRFGLLASENRLIGFFYIILTFFLIPFLLIYLSR
ncbi:MAG: Na/Pi symporter [Cyclobacteriaceae bacterium]|jgi:sodium-dependent phosphate cotransporter